MYIWFLFYNAIVDGTWYIMFFRFVLTVLSSICACISWFSHYMYMYLAPANITPNGVTMGGGARGARRARRARGRMYPPRTAEVCTPGCPPPIHNFESPFEPAGYKNLQVLTCPLEKVVHPTVPSPSPPPENWTIVTPLITTPNNIHQHWHSLVKRKHLCRLIITK